MKPLAEQTLYEILDITDDAPPGDIQRAYERARALFAPGSLATYTLMAPEDAVLLGRRIEEARNVLLDPAARAGYDARLASLTPPPRTGPASDSTPTVTATVPPGFQQIPEAAGPPPSTTAAPAPPAAPPAPVAAAAPSPPPVVAPWLPTPASAPPPAVEAAPRAAEPPGAPPREAERPAPPRSPEKALFVPEGARWSGEVLRRAREARDITVAQLAERTKVTRHHIENLEADLFERLPAPVYVRGIVMSIARELHLDGQKVARSYLEHMEAALRDRR